MKFNKEFLIEETYNAEHDEIVDTSRWSIHHRMIFKHEEKYYETYYSVGATECQDESPFEYEDEEIECEEVELKEVIIKKWVKKEI